MKGLATEMKEMSAREAVAEVIGILFMSRTYAHMAHLKTPSYSKHKALNAFYDEVVELADSLAEVGQGKFGKLDIPAVPVRGNVEKPIEAIQMQMEDIMAKGEYCRTGALRNIMDEIEALYLKTLYLMKELS